MAASTERDFDTLKAEFAELKSDVLQLTETIKNLSGDMVEEGRDRFRRQAARSREQARYAVNAVEGEIGDRPLTSVAAAFGVGFIIGRLFDR